MIPKSLRRSGAILLFVLLPALTAGSAAAQDTEMRALMDRLSQIEKQMRTLERAVYRGETPRPADGTPASAGTSMQSGDAGRLANAEVRMSRLEEQLRQLTGRVEEVRHAIDQVGGRLDKLVSDVDFRLSELERQMRQSTSRKPQQESTGDAPATAGQQAAAAPSGGSTAASGGVLPEGSAMERYGYARSLLRKLDFAGAEAAFKEFLEEHPDDHLAGNAYYWLGETYYSSNRLEDAARAFLLGYQQFSKGNKAPDTLLKLGITLRKMGQKDEACATFLELDKKFPDASQPVRTRLNREMSEAGCA